MKKWVPLALAVLALLCVQKASAILDANEITSLMTLRTALPHFYPPKWFSPFHTLEQLWFDWDLPLDWPETSEGWLSVCSNENGDGPNVFGLTCKHGHIHAMSWYVTFTTVSNIWARTKSLGEAVRFLPTPGAFKFFRLHPYPRPNGTPRI